MVFESFGHSVRVCVHESAIMRREWNRMKVKKVLTQGKKAEKTYTHTHSHTHFWIFWSPLVNSPRLTFVFCSEVITIRETKYMNEYPRDVMARGQCNQLFFWSTYYVLTESHCHKLLPDSSATPRVICLKNIKERKRGRFNSKVSPYSFPVYYETSLLRGQRWKIL